MPNNPTARLYEERMQRVSAYIHAHLDEDVDLNRLAEVACMSPYHWHRVYRALQGETVATTVKRLRLQRAAAQLANTDITVEAIACHCGYGSVASFSRAFGGVYGMPPARYRREGTHTRFQQDATTRTVSMYSVDVRTVPDVQTVAVAHQGDYLAIGQGFESLFRWLGARGQVQDVQQMMGVYYDDPSAVAEADLRSHACVVVTPLPDVEAPFEHLRVGGRECAVLRHKGPYADLHGAYQWFYGSWLPQSGRETDDSPPFEAYLNNPQDTPPTELMTDIFLPLK